MLLLLTQSQFHWCEVDAESCNKINLQNRQKTPCSSSSSRNEYYYGGIIALLLQDHHTVLTQMVCSSQYSVHGDITALSDGRVYNVTCNNGPSLGGPFWGKRYSDSVTVY